MADLIGTASIRVDMPTVAATRAIRRMAERSEAPLTQMKLRVTEVRKELRKLQDANVTITADDQTSSGVATARTAVQELRNLGPVRIAATVDDQTTSGLLAVREATNAMRALGPVRIPVAIDDDTEVAASAVRTTVAGLQALGPVRITAELDSDLTAIGATTVAFNELRDAVRRVSTALGALATRATTAVAALVALGAVARTLRGEMNDLDDAVRRASTSMSGLQGSLGTVTVSAGSAGNAMGALKSTALLLAPALIPIAVQAVPIAASLTAATAAIGVFGLAAGGQISALSEAAEAEKKYKDAVDEFGATSQQAGKAQQAFQRTVQDMPHPTRVASIALSGLKDEYRQWSDSLAASTMPVATRSFALFGAVFPKLTPVVEGAGVQLKRFVTIATGGVQSAAFDRFMKSFAEFSTGALSRGNDALIRFTRTLNTGKISGGVNTFMEYVRANGPLVSATLSNLTQALSNVLQGAANVGPGLLTVVNALAGLVAAVPPGMITVMLQLAIALKAVRLAAAGMAAASLGATAFAAAIGGMRTAAAGATGVLPRLAAAFGTLSRAAKVAVAGTGIGLLVIALSELSQIGKKAPPDVDRMTTSIGKLGQSGKVGGEALRVYGKDLGGLGDAIHNLSDMGGVDKVQNFLTNLIGMDSTPVKKWKEDLDAADQGLANLVKGGKSELAAAALERISAAYKAQGHDISDIKPKLDDYRAALADQKFEQQVAAEAMGLFGQQAQKTSATLAEQKASADGLRQAIQALNDVNRAGLGGMIGFEAAIDAASKAAQDNAGVLSMQGGQLSLNTDKQRAAAQSLTDLASKTDEAAAAARENGQSWSSVNGIYERGRQQLVQSAVQMGLTRDQAKALADQILKTPNKTALLKADITDWKTKIATAETQLKTAKGDKKAKLTADIADWKAKVAAADLQLKGTKASKSAKLTANIADWKAKVAAASLQLRTAKGEKKAKLSANITDWQRKISAAQRQINGLPSSRSTTLSITKINTTIYRTKGSLHDVVGATGGLYTGTDFKFRGKGYADGGLVNGPGTETSDSVFAPFLSKNEFVVNAKQTARHLPLLKAINSGQAGLAAGGLAGGSMAGAGAEAGAGLVSGMAAATRSVEQAARAMAAAVRTGVREELQISSPSRVMRALAKDVGKGFLVGLTGSRDKIKSVSKDLASDVRAAFSGRRETNLIKMIGRTTDRLLSEAKKRDAVIKKIADARAFSSDVAGKARATGSLGSIVQSDFFAPSYVEKRMKAALASVKTFSANVSKLQKKGLSKALLRQVLEMGPEAGGAFAKSLAGADAATIKRYNKLQADLDKQSKSLGNKGADMLYDSGRKAGAGFLTGLKAQQKSIERLMLSIAKGMQKAIRRALKIKSPSMVMDEVGQMAVLGLRGGIVRRLPLVQAAMGRVAATVKSGVPDRVRTAVSPTASVPQLSVGASRRPTGAGVTTVVYEDHYHVHAENHGVIGSQLELDNWMTKSLDRLSRRRRLPAGAGAR